jgi:hypothetical protein
VGGFLEGSEGVGVDIGELRWRWAWLGGMVGKSISCSEDLSTLMIDSGFALR